MRVLGIVARTWLLTCIATWYLARYAVGRFGTLFVRGKDARRRAVAHLRGRILRLAMTRAGATFVKLGQVMSTRPDLLDREVIDELRALQDRLPPFPFAEVRAAVESDLGGRVEDHYRVLDPEPIAAASVAQVHRGELADGTEVAVKVLRPGVRARIERDASILLTLARLGELSPKIRASDPVGHLRHFVGGILDQTDLTLEARNYETFRANFRDFEGVIFPHVHAAHSGRRVLTMDFVRGTKVDALPPGDHRKVIERLRGALLKMLFDDGFVHADLHPGNFLVTDAQEIAIFDVGLVKHLPDEALVQYIDWNRCLVMGTTDDYVRHLKRYFLGARENVDWAALTHDVDEFAKSFRGKSAKAIEASKIVDEALAIGRKYGLRPMVETTLIIVAVVTAEGVGKQLDPDTDSLAVIAGYLTPILARRGML